MQENCADSNDVACERAAAARGRNHRNVDGLRLIHSGGEILVGIYCLNLASGNGENFKLAIVRRACSISRRSACRKERSTSRGDAASVRDSHTTWGHSQGDLCAVWNRGNSV